MKRLPKQKYIYSPFHLRKYQVENDPTGEKAKKVHDHLANLCTLMHKNLDTYYHSQEWPQLITRLASDTNTNLSGKKNAAGRKLGVKPPHAPDYQPYNFAEMYRTNILSKADAYIQRLRIAWIIDQHPDEDAAEIQQRYIELYEETYFPKRAQIEKIKAARKNGCIQSAPTADWKLPFSATDGHYRQLSADDEHIRFEFPISKEERVVLVFNRPKDARFHMDKQKIPAPDVSLDSSGELVFTFSAYSAAPKEYEPEGWLGVDLGIVEPYVATVVSEDSFSQPFFCGRRVRRLAERIANESRQVSQLADKILLCEECGRWGKADFLRGELARVSASRSRKKAELARVAAFELVSLALEFGVGIAFEDLRWVPESHWNQADLQADTRVLAARFGVPVCVVGAAGTSTVCARCGESGYLHGRDFVCRGGEDLSVARRERARVRAVGRSRRNQESVGGVRRKKAERAEKAEKAEEVEKSVGGALDGGAASVGRGVRVVVNRDVNASRRVGVLACELRVLPVWYCRLVRNPAWVRSCRARCIAPCNTPNVSKNGRAFELCQPT